MRQAARLRLTNSPGDRPQEIPPNAPAIQITKQWRATLLIEATPVDDFELVIGFAAPIGTDLEKLFSCLSEELRKYDYSSDSIRLSHLLDDTASAVETVGYYEARMNSGDELRRKFGSGDVLAALAVGEIIRRRGTDGDNRRHAWLLRTLKHVDEVRLLRQTYGSRFILIGVHQNLMKRTRNLNSMLRDEAPSGSHHASKVAQLIRRDEADVENEHGQHGRDTYASADYFIDLDVDVNAEVERLMGLLFATPFITPRKHEVAMFHAFGASLRSADPGRQVGAAITTSEGELLATGSNEVPRPGGGEYWAGDDNDSRDFQLGHDYNKKQTRRTLSELLSVLAENGLLEDSLAKAGAEDRVRKVLAAGGRDVKQSRMMSLIEFGRIVHAEMSALMQAARLGIPVKDGVLYTTAFPCHMCMRLIISSGVRRVVYVDPYPKSLAVEMYPDAIVEDEDGNGGKLHVVPYIGTSWRVYPELFRDANRDREADGKFKHFNKTKARMRLAAVDPLLNSLAREAQIPVALSEAGIMNEDKNKSTLGEGE